MNHELFPEPWREPVHPPGAVHIAPPVAVHGVPRGEDRRVQQPGQGPVSGGQTVVTTTLHTDNNVKFIPAVSDSKVDNPINVNSGALKKVSKVYNITNNTAYIEDSKEHTVNSTEQSTNSTLHNISNEVRKVNNLVVQNLNKTVNSTEQNVNSTINSEHAKVNDLNTTESTVNNTTTNINSPVQNVNSTVLDVNSTVFINASESNQVKDIVENVQKIKDNRNTPEDDKVTTEYKGLDSEVQKSNFEVHGVQNTKSKIKPKVQQLRKTETDAELKVHRFQPTVHSVSHAVQKSVPSVHPTDHHPRSPVHQQPVHQADAGRYSTNFWNIKPVPRAVHTPVHSVRSTVQGVQKPVRHTLPIIR